MIACYDLQHRLPTFDFCCWLTHVRLLGATEITFDLGDKFFLRKKWSPEDTLRRLENCLKPACALADLPWRMGTDGDHEIGSHLHQVFWRDVQANGGSFPLLRTVLPLAGDRFTVTMRQTFWRRERNSDPNVWHEFARRIGARVFEDYDTKSTPLHERVASYAGARMNYGVPTGPLSLCFWTNYPLTQFCDPELFAKPWAAQGVPVNGQVPWFLPNQQLVWEKPTMDNLMREFDRMANERVLA